MHSKEAPWGGSLDLSDWELSWMTINVPTVKGEWVDSNSMALSSLGYCRDIIFSYPKLSHRQWRMLLHSSQSVESLANRHRDAKNR